MALQSDQSRDRRAPPRVPRGDARRDRGASSATRAGGVPVLAARRRFEERAGPCGARGPSCASARTTLARLMALEMGKPLAQGRAEAEKCAWVCDYYAERAEGFLAAETVRHRRREELRGLRARSGWCSRSCPGTSRSGRCSASRPPASWPATRASSSTPRTSPAARSPSRRSSTTRASRAASSARCSSAPRRGGRDHRVARGGGGDPDRQHARRPRGGGAGRGASSRRPCSSWGAAIPTSSSRTPTSSWPPRACAASRLINGGQSCIAAKRFIVVEPVRKRFEELFVESDAGAADGRPPRGAAIDLGPQARRDLRDELHEQVEKSVARGARVLLGGVGAPGPGRLLPAVRARPTCARGCPPTTRSCSARWPRSSRCEDEAEAIRVANDTPFGLGRRRLHPRRGPGRADRPRGARGGRRAS